MQIVLPELVGNGGHMFRTVSIATLMAPSAGADSFFSYSTAELMEIFAYGGSAGAPSCDDGHETRTRRRFQLVSVSTRVRPDRGT